MFGILIWVLGFQVNDGIFLGLGLISKLVLSFWVCQWFVLCSVQASVQASVCYVSSVYLFEICVQNMLVVVCYFLFTFLFSLP